MKTKATAFLTLFFLLVAPTLALAQWGDDCMRGSGGGMGRRHGMRWGMTYAWTSSGNWGSMGLGGMGQWDSDGWGYYHGYARWGRDHARGVMQAEGLVVSVASNPATQLAVIAYDPAGSAIPYNDMARRITANIDSNTVFSVDDSRVDLSGLPFVPTFGGSDLLEGQAVAVIHNNGMSHDGRYGYGMGHGAAYAIEVHLEEQAFRGGVANYWPTGNQAMFTLSLAPNSLFANLTGTTLITVYQQESTVLWRLNNVRNGAIVEVSGLLFFDSGTYRLVASRIAAP